MYFYGICEVSLNNVSFISTTLSIQKDHCKCSPIDYSKAAILAENNNVHQIFRICLGFAYLIRTWMYSVTKE